MAREPDFFSANAASYDRSRPSRLSDSARDAIVQAARLTLHGCLLDVAAGTGAALNLPNATWLTFRRTYASWAHDKGVPGKVVAHLMGHTNADVTLNVYTEVLMHRSAQRSIASVANCSRLFTNRERGRS